MAKDVLITPASGLIQFYDADGNVDATIQLDDANVLNISGTVSLGDLASDVYIGDGVNEVDIVFEQNGIIYALAGKTLTLGQANSSISLAANITSGANITGNVTTSGNITANYVLGNIYFATGFSASKIFNGVSEVNIGTANGAANISIAGTSNVAVFSATGLAITGDLSVTGNATLSGNILGDRLVNGTTNIEIPVASGNANISVAGTSNVAIFASTGVFVSGVNSASGNVTGGNLVTAGQLTASGNITGSSIIAVSNGQGTNFRVGDDAWIGDINQADTISIRGLQNAANAYIVFGNASVAQLGRSGTGPLTYSGAFSATGNVTGGNLITAGLITATGAITGAAISGTTISGSGNVTGANIVTAGLITATGNIRGAAISGTTISGSGNVTGANIVTAGLITATGNVTGGNVITAGSMTATGSINTSANVSAVGNIAGNYFVGNGSQLTGILTGNSFGTIVVSGQSNVVADSASDTLTLIAGSGIAIVTDSGNDSVTISQVATDSIFATGGDMGTVTEAVTVSEDLGLITSAATVEYDLGTLTTGGIVTPSYLLLPSYTVSQLASLTANPAGQFVFCSNESGGSVPAFSDGTNWRRVTDRAIVS